MRSPTHLILERSRANPQGAARAPLRVASPVQPIEQNALWLAALSGQDTRRLVHRQQPVVRQKGVNWYFARLVRRPVQRGVHLVGDAWNILTHVGMSRYVTYVT